MTSPEEQALLKRIMTRVDQLGRLKSRIGEGALPPETLDRLQRESRRKINEIGNELLESTEASPLVEVVDRFSLDKFQIVILLGLLQRTLLSEESFLTGREILNMLFDESFDVLKGLSYIDETSVLVSSGLIVKEAGRTSPADTLAARFKLSERFLDMIMGMLSGSTDDSRDRLEKSAEPYKNNRAYLLDLRKLSLLYRKRATKIFNYDYWNDIGTGVSDPVRAINAQIQALRDIIELRLARTRNRDGLFTYHFARSQHLSEEEVVILVTLLFQELTEGSAYVNAVDLLKLISLNEDDLLKKRRFFSKRNTLIKNQLIVLEDMVNDKELTGEVFMPNWAIDLILTGAAQGEGAIDSDARMDFHNYLKNLESSDDFFDNLDM